MSEDARITAKYRLIDLHYEAQADELRWTAHRFRRLAAALQLTTYELGALIRLRVHQTEGYLKKDAFPPPAELHLTLIERALLPSSKPPVFPSLQCSSTSTS